MPTLNLDLDWFNHPKAVRMTAMLGEIGPYLPIKLWVYAAKFHVENGRLEGYSDADIEQICGWRGAAGRLIECLTKREINLLERGEGFFQIHDWLDHAGHLVAYKKRAKTAAKAKWKRVCFKHASSNAKARSSNAKACIALHCTALPGSESSGESPRGGMPDGLNPDTWAEFRRMRSRIKHPLTPHAEKLLLADLDKFREQGYDPNQIVEQSIKNSWRGLFEIKPGGKQNAADHGHHREPAGFDSVRGFLKNHQRG